MESVITEFVDNIKDNQDTAGHPDGEPGNVDE
jgi:hypothetical protein